jgi:PIN domain nuclease of toxin-antitoxin system
MLGYGGCTLMGRKLPDELRSWLENAGDPLAVSVISALEVAQLVKKRKLELPLGLPDWFDAALTDSGIHCLPVSPRLLHASTILPDIHKDPADRIIIATAHDHDIQLVTADEAIQAYPGIRTVWNLQREQAR